MSLVAEPKATNYKPLPEGLVPVVISEVKDLGMVEIPAQYRQEGGPTERPQMQIEFRAADGSTAIKTYTISTHELARIVQDLKMAGITIPARFDFSTLKGTQLQVLSSHATSRAGKVYAKISAFSKPAVGQNV